MPPKIIKNLQSELEEELDFVIEDDELSEVMADESIYFDKNKNRFFSYQEDLGITHLISLEWSQLKTRLKDQLTSYPEGFDAVKEEKKPSLDIAVPPPPPKDISHLDVVERKELRENKLRKLALSLQREDMNNVIRNFVGYLNYLDADISVHGKDNFPQRKEFTRGFFDQAVRFDREAAIHYPQMLEHVMVQGGDDLAESLSQAAEGIYTRLSCRAAEEFIATFMGRVEKYNSHPSPKKRQELNDFIALENEESLQVLSGLVDRELILLRQRNYQEGKKTAARESEYEKKLIELQEGLTASKEHCNKLEDANTQLTDKLDAASNENLILQTQKNIDLSKYRSSLQLAQRSYRDAELALGDKLREYKAEKALDDITKTRRWMKRTCVAIVGAAVLAGGLVYYAMNREVGDTEIQLTHAEEQLDNMEKRLEETQETIRRQTGIILNAEDTIRRQEGTIDDAQGTILRQKELLGEYEIPKD